jgi:hypothetical protein
LHYEEEAIMSAGKHNPRNEKPMSLHPLSLKQALKKAMQAKVPEELPESPIPQQSKKAEGRQSRFPIS